MKVLILGAKGMLGKALAVEFKNGYEVFAYDKEDLDVTDKNKTKTKLEKIKPNIVINAAAYNAVDKIEENADDERLAKQINGYAVGALAEICRNLNIILVHYSSDYVFKGDKKDGYNEEDIPGPVNKYGETKLLGEKQIINFQSQIPNLKFYLIRLSKLFGKSGEDAGVKKSFIDVILDLHNKGKREFDLIDEELSCPTYAPDLARLTRELVESGRPWGIYHGANNGACAWYDFAREIFKIENFDVKCNPLPAARFPRLSKRPRYSVLLNTKLPPQRSWQEALKEYLEKR